MSIVLLGSSSGSVTLQEPAVAGSTVIDLPATSGTMAVLPTSTSVLPEASGGTGTSIGYNGFKNRIINGAMVIDQRSSGTVTASNTSAQIYLVDRWAYRVFTGSAASKISFQRSSVAPDGFVNSMLVTSLSSYSIGSSDAFQFRQPIEGFNIADFGWGTANAKPVTLSFWVRSSLTGTFGGGVWNATDTRFYVFSYSISAANTWEFKTVTITGETSGVWNTTNGIGLNVSFSLGAGASLQGTSGSWGTSVLIAPTGQVNVSGTNGATWQVTGVQLEKGATATSFDYRPYTTELQLCQRYYFKVATTASNATFGAGFANDATRARIFVPFAVEMRIDPVAVEQTGTASDYKVAYLTTAATCTDVPSFANAQKNGGAVNFTVASGLTGGNGIMVERNANTAFLAWSAEL